MTGLVTEVATLDAVAQANLVRSGQVTATELVWGAIDRIEALNPTLNAVITPTFDSALAAAATMPATGPLSGVPFLVKDLVVEIAGVPFHEGSKFLSDHVSTYDSEIVRRWRRAGLMILGKTNCPEFGMVPATEPLSAGATRNPWDVGRSTSGSSGGSAAAVASGMVPMAHGNDAGGSLRYPASACGLFGLKPTRARNPLGPEYGDAIAGWACEHALTRTVRDSAVLLDATAGPDVGDPYPAPTPSRPFALEVGAHPGRLRIAYTSRTPEGVAAHPDCVTALDHAVALLTDLGHEIVEADLPGLTPDVGKSIGTVFLATTDWIVRYWVDRIGREPADGELEPLTRAYLERSRTISGGRFLQAVETCQRFGRTVARFLAGFDAWLTPTMSTLPLPIGEITSTNDDPWRAARNGGSTVGFAGVVANITGNPAMSVPMHWTGDDLPVGVHFLGRFGDEATLFRLAAQLEDARPWVHRWPSVSAVPVVPGG